MQGVAVFCGARGPQGAQARITYADVIGPRKYKYDRLSATTSSQATIEVTPTPKQYFLIPRDTALESEFEAGISIRELFNQCATGMVTAHDHIVIAHDDRSLKAIAKLLRDPAVSDEAARKKLSVKDNAGWKLERARRVLRIGRR